MARRRQLAPQLTSDEINHLTHGIVKMLPVLSFCGLRRNVSAQCPLICWFKGVLENIEDNAETPLRSRAERGPVKARSRTERARYNGRSREAVRVRMLAAGFRAQLGDAADNPVMAAAITRAAELVMLAEQKRAAMIRSEPVDLGDLIRLEGAARRAIADLHLKPAAAREVPNGMAALQAHIARKYGPGAVPEADDFDDEDEAEADAGEEAEAATAVAEPAGEFESADDDGGGE